MSYGKLCSPSKRVFINRQHDIFYFGPPHISASPRDFEILEALDIEPDDIESLDRNEAMITRLKDIHHFAFHSGIWEAALPAFYEYGARGGLDAEREDVPIWVISMMRDTNIKRFDIVEEFCYRGEGENGRWFLEELRKDYSERYSWLNMGYVCRGAR